MKNLHYTVTKDNKPQFRGSDFDCFEYILKHQPNSVDHATKYEGWKIQKTSLEGLIIEACLQEDGFENATIAQALENASRRFRSEYDWQINHDGLLKACKEWFQGIALQVPIWNDEIDQLGFDPEFYFEQIATAFVGMTENNAPDVANALTKDEYANWSHNGALALAEYLEEYEESTGEELELDVIALRCDFSEYISLVDWFDDHFGSLGEEFGIDYLNPMTGKVETQSTTDCDGNYHDEILDGIKEYIEERGTLIEFDGGIIVAQF